MYISSTLFLNRQIIQLFSKLFAELGLDYADTRQEYCNAASASKQTWSVSSLQHYNRKHYRRYYHIINNEH